MILLKTIICFISNHPCDYLSRYKKETNFINIFVLRDLREIARIFDHVQYSFVRSLLNPASVADAAQVVDYLFDIEENMDI